MIKHPGEKILALYLHADVNSRERAALSAHLELCSRCQAVVADLRAAHALFVGFFGQPADEDVECVRQRIRNGLPKLQKNRPQSWQWPGLAAVFAAMLCTVVISLTMGKHSSKEAAPKAPPLQNVALIPRVLPDLVFSTEPVSHLSSHPKQRGRDPGFRTVSFVSRSDGSSELRLTTADPNVIILLEPAERTDLHEN